MRHGASMLVSLEGMSRAAFHIACELANNSRSGLTTRFLSKKLDIPEVEVEYILDVNHRLLFTDLTKVKLVPEGYNAIKRITEGLENHGDVPSLIRRIRSLNAHDFRRLEEQLGLDQPVAKKTAAEELIDRFYRHPDSIVNYVATRGFSQTARELFDLVWQSKDGILPLSKLRAAHGGSEFEVEQALWELFRGFAVFELFRFDAEDRLVRVAALLAELRQWREASTRLGGRRGRLKPHKQQPERCQSHQLSFSDNLCHLVAAIAAHPVRLRGDGDLFREDRKRLADIVPEEAEPPLSTCIWVAQGAGWLIRVDDELRAGELDALIAMDRVERHRMISEWFLSQPDDLISRKILTSMLDELKPGVWFSVPEFLEAALQVNEENDQPVLKQKGAAWVYQSAGASGQWETRLARSIEETFFWLGFLDRAEMDNTSLFRLTPLGEAMLRGGDLSPLRDSFGTRKCEFIVQPNFEIVVPAEDMDPLLTVPLDQFAYRLSSGQATVYQVTKESFTHGLQEGHDGDGFVNFLLRHNRVRELPVNVMTTLEDWRGAMKRVRLRTVHILESDDPLVIADLLHRRRFRKHLEQADPRLMLTYNGISRTELAKALEKDGFIVE